MPLVRIVSSAETPSGTEALLKRLSGLLAKELGKPESYVMTCLEPRAQMTFAGTPAPTCYIEVKNVGTLSPDVTKRLSAALTEVIAPALGVAKDRIYIEFAEAKPHHWGFAGDTFA